MNGREIILLTALLPTIDMLEHDTTLDTDESCSARPFVTFCQALDGTPRYWCDTQSVSPVHPPIRGRLGYVHDTRSDNGNSVCRVKGVDATVVLLPRAASPEAAGFTTDPLDTHVTSAGIEHLL